MNVYQLAEAIKRAHEKLVATLDEAYQTYRSECVAATESFLGNPHDVPDAAPVRGTRDR